MKITDDPLAYAKEQVALYNDEEKSSKITMEVKIDFEEKIKINKDLVSSSTNLNIGYLYLQQLYHELEIGSFFQQISADSKITFESNTVNRFLTFARVLYPDSKLGTYQHLNHYYEKPSFSYNHSMRTMDLMAEHYVDEVTGEIIKGFRKYGISKQH